MTDAGPTGRTAGAAYGPTGRTIGAYREVRQADGSLALECTRDLRQSAGDWPRDPSRRLEQTLPALMRHGDVLPPPIAGLGGGPDLLASRTTVLKRGPRRVPSTCYAGYVRGRTVDSSPFAEYLVGRHALGEPAREPERHRVATKRQRARKDARRKGTAAPRPHVPSKRAGDDDRRAAERRTAGSMAWLAEASA